MEMSVLPSPDAYPGLSWHMKICCALLLCGSSGGCLKLLTGDEAQYTPFPS